MVHWIFQYQNKNSRLSLYVTNYAPPPVKENYNNSSIHCRLKPNMHTTLLLWWVSGQSFVTNKILEKWPGFKLPAELYINLSCSWQWSSLYRSFLRATIAPLLYTCSRYVTSVTSLKYNLAKTRNKDRKGEYYYLSRIRPAYSQIEMESDEDYKRVQKWCILIVWAEANSGVLCTGVLLVLQFQFNSIHF